MKKLVLPLIFLLLVLPGMSQGWVFVDGTVTSLEDSLPVVNHPVTIFADSSNGVIYYNVVYTDSAGHYFDIPPVMNSQGMLTVQTTDCNNNLQQAFFTYDSANTTFTHDFRICTSTSDCEAYFSYYEVAYMTFQFQDQSVGDPQSWNWEFGDGITSSEQHPLHYYVAGGWYNVTLTIGNEPAGCTDTFTREIYVSDSSAWICQAFYSFFPEPQGSPDSFRFNDLSTGFINSWLWDFGDGTFSEEQNPLHLFPGPGTYETCLLITGDNCSDTYCNTIVISDTVYQQIYGQVFSGNFPMQTGTVMLFAHNPGGGYYPLREGSPVDSNGIYIFSLVPEGNYLIQAIPSGSNGLLPTYYGDVTGWQQSTQVVPGIPAGPYNINLVAVGGPLTAGPGSLSGRISSGPVDSSSVNLINMMLMNESGLMIGFGEVDKFGYFNFLSLDYGTYFLRAELSGVTSDYMRFDITYDNLHVDVVLNYSGNSVLDVIDYQAVDGLISMYPNPFSDRLTISCNLREEDEIRIGIYSMTGQVVFMEEYTRLPGLNEFRIPTDRFTGGVYILRISSVKGFSSERRVVKID